MVSTALGRRSALWPARHQADLLAQLKAQAGPPVPRGALIKDSMQVLLLSLALAMGFAVGARRRSLAEVGPAETVGVVGAVVPG